MLSKDTSWTKMEGQVADYHAMGVDLVWVLDPQTVTLRAYPRGEGPLLLRDTDTATADPHVPGFSVSVGAFSEELGRLVVRGFREAPRHRLRGARN